MINSQAKSRGFLFLFMNKKFIEEMKIILEKQKTDTEKQLSEIAEKSRRNKNGYEAKFPQYGRAEDENADEVATYVDAVSLGDSLTSALAEIERALEKIEKNTYGICENCHETIDEKRLRAFPAARWCLACKTKTK